MKRFAVATTQHVIDHLGLDPTQLNFYRAKNAYDAARQSLCERMLERESDDWQELEEDLRVVVSLKDPLRAAELKDWKRRARKSGIPEDQNKGSKKQFLARRKLHWLKTKLEKDEDEEYDFIYRDDDADDVFAFVVREIK